MSDITVERAAPRSIAAIGAFSNKAPLLAALATEFAAAIPTSQGFIHAGAVTLSCLSPSRYVASAGRDTNLAQRLAKSLAGFAAVTDQSDLWAIFTLSGPRCRDALARLVPIDVHPHIFPVGALALTRASHLDVRLWHVADDAYEVAVGRSYAEDFGHWVKQEGSVLF